MPKEIEPNRNIREWVEADGPKGWKHKDLAKDMYSMANIMRLYFFSQKEPGQYLMPDPLVAIERMRVETLAAYHLVENPIGLKYQITLNELYLDRDLYSLYESLCHELVHLYQENHPDLPKCKNGYHNEAFVRLCEDVGLHPRLGSGAHRRPADGQFERLMARYGVAKPKYEVEPVVPPAEKKTNWWGYGKEVKKGASTLKLYLCKCQPPFKIRTGRDNLLAMCLTCGSVFMPEQTGQHVK